MGKRNSFIPRTPLLFYTEYKPFQSIFDFYYVHLSAHTRPKDIRSEFSYRGVRVVHEHTNERGLYDADHVRDDKQPHEISRAESVNGSGEQTRCRHLNVRHERSETLDAHRAYAERRYFLISDFFSLFRALPIAPQSEQTVLKLFFHNFPVPCRIYGHVHDTPRTQSKSTLYTYDLSLFSCCRAKKPRTKPSGIVQRQRFLRCFMRSDAKPRSEDE